MLFICLCVKEFGVGRWRIYTLSTPVPQGSKLHHLSVKLVLLIRSEVTQPWGESHDIRGESGT